MNQVNKEKFKQVCGVLFEEECIRIACRNEVITGKNAKDFPGLMIGSYVCLKKLAVATGREAF